MNFSKVKDNALKYLGYQGQRLDETMNQLIDECLEEIQTLADFKVVSKTYHLSFHPLKIKEVNCLINYPDLNELFQNCDEVMIIACTLGIQFDRKIKYYSKINMTKMTILDAVGSSYLEALCDEYEQSFQFKERTFRFCPGYGHVPIELNHDLARILDCSKHIGLTIQDSHILLPQKSMIGLIGIGESKMKKSCHNCINIKNCAFRKRGQRCYKID